MKDSKESTAAIRYEAPSMQVVGGVSKLTLGNRRGNWDDGSGHAIKHWVWAF